MGLYYNGDGVRLYKETNADLCKKYVVDGMNTVVEQDGGGSLRYRYIYASTGLGTSANGMLLAKIDNNGNKYYYHHDGQGTIVGMSNTTPEVTTAMLFDDFGNWLYWDSNWDYYTYTGQEYDWPLTDAYNLRAREYYPEYGRFMQEDPIGNNGGSLNWYSYVRNNPVNWTDITGLIPYHEGNGGPFHFPNDPSFRCKFTDNCSTLDTKIWMFNRMLNSHMGWVIAHPNDPRNEGHMIELLNLRNGLTKCKIFYALKKCSNCNNGSKSIPQRCPQGARETTLACILISLLPLILAF